MNHRYQGIGVGRTFSQRHDTQLSWSHSVQLCPAWNTVGYAVAPFSIIWVLSCLVISQFSTVHVVKSGGEISAFLHICISWRCDNLLLHSDTVDVMFWTMCPDFKCTDEIWCIHKIFHQTLVTYIHTTLTIKLMDVLMAHVYMVLCLKLILSYLLFRTL